MVGPEIICQKDPLCGKEQDMSVDLKITLKPKRLAVMYPLLQQGFQVAATVGCDIRTLLCDQFGLMPHYLSDRINTIFLNGKPVDDVATAVVDDGATLALSAAMPGLVGATFRKAGCLAAFRGSITYQKIDIGPSTCHEGSITIKLFNLLVDEVGPLFLARGIWIEGGVWQSFAKANASNLEASVDRIEKDQCRVALSTLADSDGFSPETRIFLTVVSST